MNRRLVLKEMGFVALYSSFPSVPGEFLSSHKMKEMKLRAGFFSDALTARTCGGDTIKET